MEELSKKWSVIQKSGLKNIVGGVADPPAGFTDCEKCYASTYDGGKYTGQDVYWSCGDEATIAGGAGRQ